MPPSRLPTLGTSVASERRDSSSRRADAPATVYLGTTCESSGEPAPEHAFPEDARGRPVGTYVVEVVADGDPNRVRRIAVRFATPTCLGEQLVLRLYDAGALGYAFEADCAGATVITHARAELR